MPYTVWSRGRLIGSSTLGYARSFTGLRGGDFEPTPLGETLMPIITGVGPALEVLSRVVGAARGTPEGLIYGDLCEPFPDAVHYTTAYADAVSIADELDSLALELRDPKGEVVPTENISVRDTEYLLARARETRGEFGDDYELADLSGLGLDDEEIAELERQSADLLDFAANESADAEWASQADGGDWDPQPPFPRYQIFVTLKGGWGTICRVARPGSDEED